MFSLNMVDYPLFSYLLSTWICCALQVEDAILEEAILREDVQRKKLPKFGHLAKDPYPTYLTPQFGQQKVWTIFFV